MNIFYLHHDPVVAASYLCDKHILKMGIESAQMLSTAHWLSGGSAPYRKTHANHPSSIWARSSSSHYDWLVRHAYAILNEYTRRYGKPHKTFNVIRHLDIHRPSLPMTAFVQPPQCMPDKFKCNDSIQAYRNFYVHDKIMARGMAYVKSTMPTWVSNMISA
jgi:hypothetical protein